MTKISVIYPSCRIGGVDVLVNTLETQRFKDFEAIFVDELYDFRKGMVDDYAEKHGVNIRHVSPKEAKGIPFQIANNMNTGLLWAEGELIVILEDYMWAGPDWLKMHWDLYSKFGSLTVGSVKYVPMPEIKWKTPLIMRNQQFCIKDEQIAEGLVSIFKEEFKGDVERLERQVYMDDYRKIGELKGQLVEKRYKFVEGKWFWGNMSVPLETILNLNGWDEHYNGGHGYNEIDVGERAELLGQKILYDPENTVYHFDHKNLFQTIYIFDDNHIYHNIRMERMKADLSLIPAPNPYNIRRWRDVMRGRVRYEVASSENGDQIRSVETLTYKPVDMHRYEWIRRNVEGFILEVGAQDGSIWRASEFAFGQPINLEKDVVLFDCDVWKQNVPSVLMRGDGSKLPFREETFDTVVLDHILEHVPSPQKILEEAKRVTRKMIIVNVPDELSWHPSLKPKVNALAVEEDYDALIERHTTKLPSRFSKCLRHVDENKLHHLWHVRIFNSDSFRNLMKETGLKMELFKLRYHYNMFVDFAAILHKEG